jgi:hypothetical protein
MELSMRSSISYIALAVVLAAGTTAANAQTVITREISAQPVETVITRQPVQTVQTTETVRTVRPAPRSALHRQVVTTRRTTVSERVVPTQTVTTPAPVDTAVAANPRPLYEQAPLYDTVAAPSTLDETVVNAPFGPATAIPTYRYVYEPDRILVIDPTTGIAIQALPR